MNHMSEEFGITGRKDSRTIFKLTAGTACKPAWRHLCWIFLGLASCKHPFGKQDSKDWPSYGGNKAGNRYSTLTQINTSNVKDLKVAWMYNASDSLAAGKRPREIECQPIVVHGVLYGTTPELKLFALNAATGRQLWRFDPSAKAQGYNSASRGLSYWEDGNDRRILYSAGTNLYAINADNGQPVPSFGNNGKVDLHTGLENDRYDVKDLAITATSPGVIYKNIFVNGSTVSESGDALPGHIRGFDVRSGKLLWTFHTIPQPGDPGYDTWPKDAYKKIGAANNWAGLVLDEKRGVVYLGTGAPAVDFYGGQREGANLFADCILALDATTGKLKWYYQLIHHDLWDNDIPCPPNLVTVMHNGKKVDAVVQTTKDGLVYVLDRDSGTSLFPVEERSVPTAGLPGEHPFPTQKFPLRPLPFSRQFLTDADLPDSTVFPEAYRFAKEQFGQSRHGQKFLPPGLDGIIYIGISGGAEWGGNAVDSSGILYQNGSEMPWNVKMVDLATSIKESTSQGNALYITNCSACHGLDRKGSASFPDLSAIGKKLPSDEIRNILQMGRGRMPSFQSIPEWDRNKIIAYLLHQETKPTAIAGKSVTAGKSANIILASTGKSATAGTPEKDEHSDKGPMAAKDPDFPYTPPYIRGRGGKFRDPKGYPAIKPPWGTLNAIDLNTGEYLWRVPLGEYPELTNKGIPITGTENSGGPVVTAGGLLFIAGTEDERLRAFDTKTGKVVWESQLPAGAWATPITYEIDGKQFVVIAAGGVRANHKPGGNYIAFALP
jgi:quinoprotein glucose dehydrogenase